MIQQCPKGRLLDICLSHFSKVIQGNESLILDCITDNTTEKKELCINNEKNSNDENRKKYENNLKEHIRRKIAALDAISDIFLSEIEHGTNEDFHTSSISSTHVHTASCNHGHHDDTTVVR